MAQRDGEALTVRMRRVLDAPITAAFNACTDPPVLGRWWGPKGFTAPRVELDLRPGGGYRITMQPPDGDAFDLVGEFRAVDRPSRLVYTFRWEDPDPEDVETVVTLAFREVGVTTEIDVVHSGFATERRRALHDGGWTDSLDRLEELLSSRASGQQA